ncbi:hypothetical protein D3C77_371210 [compost metagenome]
MKADLWLLRQRHQCAGVIGDDHHVRVGSVFEVIEQSFVFKKALHKIEIALAILSDVTVLLERFAQAKFVLGQGTETGEHFADDVLHRFILEDARVEPAGEHPQPWSKHCRVAHKSAVAALGTEAIDIAIDVALRTIRQLNLDGCRATDQRLEFHIRALAQQRKVQLEQA